MATTNSLSDEPIDELPLDEEIEAAYLRALEASEEIVDEMVEEATPPSGNVGDEAGVNDVADADASALANIADARSAPSETVDTQPDTSQPDATEPAAVAEATEATESDGPRVTPSQVIEAALFMGGTPFTARKLCGLLRGSFEAKFVEDAIDELNTKYSQQSRPYFIKLASGGYRLELRTDYERYRHRVYGTGPKEVKLSQEVLEILAVVAYKQPISENELEKLGKKNAGNILRQLLRRELLGITRGDKPKDVRYHTTPRFLQLFGLSSLQDLPQTEDVAIK